MVDINPAFMWNILDAWTMEQAATVPVVYATAYYALVVRGQLRRGESILIHSGSGGVGQVCVSIMVDLDGFNAFEQGSIGSTH